MAKQVNSQAESSTEIAHNILSYSALISPVITEKSYALFQLKKYSFEVSIEASKQEIAKAVEMLYNVKVLQVRVMRVKPKNVFLRGKKGKTGGYKKAIVSLQAGYSITI